MFEHLLPEHDILVHEPATVARQELEANMNRIGFVLQQAEAVGGSSEDCREVGVVGFVTRIGGLAMLFGGVGMKDADFDPRFDKGALDWTMVSPSPLDDGDLVFDAMSC